MATTQNGEPAGRVEGMSDTLWERVRRDPTRAPEQIALAAAERFASPARLWAQRERHRHSPAQLAQRARGRHVTLSRLEGAALGLGGAFTAAPDLAALAWLQGRMVFFISAAYGFDPRDPMRPAELLALWEVYATPAEARAALDGLGRPLAVQYALSKRGRDEAVAARLIKLLGRTVARRAALRITPLLAAPISSTQNARATARLGDRAIAYYGGWSGR